MKAIRGLKSEFVVSLDLLSPHLNSSKNRNRDQRDGIYFMLYIVLMEPNIVFFYF